MVPALLPIATRAVGFHVGDAPRRAVFDRLSRRARLPQAAAEPRRIGSPEQPR